MSITWVFPRTWIAHIFLCHVSNTIRIMDYVMNSFIILKSPSAEFFISYLFLVSFNLGDNERSFALWDSKIFMFNNETPKSGRTCKDFARRLFFSFLFYFALGKRKTSASWAHFPDANWGGWSSVVHTYLLTNFSAPLKDSMGLEDEETWDVKCKACVGRKAFNFVTTLIHEERLYLELVGIKLGFNI